ncbi:MAG: cytochrome c3 family protein [Betaproteobacteria bacterium]
MIHALTIRAHSLLLSIGLAFLAAMPAAAAPAAAGPNDTCLMCHADKDAKGAGGKSIAVDGAKFAASVHGEMQLKCTDCHTDVSPQKLPHAEKLKPVVCATCHDKAVKEYQTTGHATARKGGNAVAATCTDCHGTHDIKRPKDPTSPTNHLNLVATCSRCHGDDATVTKGHMPGGNIGAKFQDSIHAKALQGAAKMSAPECTDCHGTHTILPKSDPKSKVSRARIPETCGSCHQRERDAYTKGMHGKLRQDGVLAAPGCTDCHTAHSIQQHEKPTFQTAVIKECGTCHADYLSTYRDTFHGQVTALGYARVATCASCHGAHEVLPASNPASKVSPQNRLKTCQACHAGASANFASFDPHADRHNRTRSPLYYYASRFMEILLLGVFSFFGIHTVFWFYRELRERISGGKAGPRDGNREERH